MYIIQYQKGSKNCKRTDLLIFYVLYVVSLNILDIVVKKFKKDNVTVKAIQLTIGYYRSVTVYDRVTVWHTIW